MSQKGGSYAFFATFRPRHGITDSTVGSIISYVNKMSRHHFAVLEKEGEERHLHLALFLNTPKQRSNIITMFISNCLTDWTEEETKNFRFWDKLKKQGAVKTLTSLEVITSYLDGTYASKCDDKYEIVSQHLPDDLSELESLLPSVGSLARTKNLWCMTLHRQLVERFNWPQIRSEDFRVSEPYLIACWKVLENENIREIQFMHRKNKIKAFLQWWNQDFLGRHDSQDITQDESMGSKYHWFNIDDLYNNGPS